MKKYIYKLKYEIIKDLFDKYEKKCEVFNTKEDIEILLETIVKQRDLILLFSDSKFYDEYKYGFFGVLRVKEQAKVKRNGKYKTTCSLVARSYKNRPMLEEIEQYAFPVDSLVKLNRNTSTYTEKQHSDLKVITYTRDILGGVYGNRTVQNNIAGLITKIVKIPSDVDYKIFLNNLIMNHEDFWKEYPKRTVKELKDLASTTLKEIGYKEKTQ